MDYGYYELNLHGKFDPCTQLQSSLLQLSLLAVYDRCNASVMCMYLYQIHPFITMQSVMSCTFVANVYSFNTQLTFTNLSEMTP